MADLRPRAGKAVTQFSFVDALVAGLYDGAFAASEVVAAGDLGLGCGDALDGELVLLNGELRVCRGDGEVALVDPSDRIPFAEVVRFEPTHHETVEGMSEAAFEAYVERLVPSNNLFYAIRLEGHFRRLTVREAVRQHKPYRGLAEAVKDQHENSIDETHGVMVGFKGPDVFQGLSVADFHLHYLDQDFAFGGHVMEFEIVSAQLSIEAYSSFTVRLPEVESYLTAELDEMNSDAAIRQAESQ